MDILNGGNKIKIATLEVQLWEPDEIKENYEKAYEKFLRENKEFDSKRDLIVDRTLNNKKWKERYPDGWTDWARSGNVATLSAKGEQMVIDRINEAIVAINALADRFDALDRELPQIRAEMDNLKNH